MSNTYDLNKAFPAGKIVLLVTNSIAYQNGQTLQMGVTGKVTGVIGPFVNLKEAAHVYAYDDIGDCAVNGKYSKVFPVGITKVNSMNVMECIDTNFLPQKRKA